eukprot:TRINITY_DN32582_c0_g1_i1.p1 TRINITY_DN32582_c0_g1~~TRINITY_DN32582_c0_g1_i1.p1  ORF type:complete len:230 (+),score=67.95 TRINITY_DN32582_c0_g1_i1:124-813(+)
MGNAGCQSCRDSQGCCLERTIVADAPGADAPEAPTPARGSVPPLQLGGVGQAQGGPEKEAGRDDGCVSTREASSAEAPGADASFDTVSQAAEACTSPAQSKEAQQVVKQFVRNMVKGTTLRVLSTNGGSAECFITLDRKLTTMSLQRAGKKSASKRGVLLEQIVQIAVGDEVADDVELQVHELCVTCFMDDGQAIAFEFDDIEQRDTFALCLSMFVDGRRDEVERKREK